MAKLIPQTVTLPAETEKALRSLSEEELKAAAKLVRELLPKSENKGNEDPVAKLASMNANQRANKLAGILTPAARALVAALANFKTWNKAAHKVCDLLAPFAVVSSEIDGLAKLAKAHQLALAALSAKDDNGRKALSYGVLNHVVAGFKDVAAALQKKDDWKGIVRLSNEMGKAILAADGVNDEETAA